MRCNDGPAADATCAADADCDFGTCTNQVVTLLPGYPLTGAAVPEQGTRWMFDVTLQAVGPERVTGSCGVRCTDGPHSGTACTTHADCGEQAQDAGFPPGLYTCGRVCSNNLLTPCTSDADCDFRMGLGTPILEGQACDGIACGDGFVDGDLGEECDDGPRNGTPESTCSCTCVTAAPTCPLDIDTNGVFETATDVVYMARHKLNLSPVPPSFRDGHPEIPTDAVMRARIDALGPP
jgi:hypothetical protein